jgi:hypothetical protein
MASFIGRNGLQEICALLKKSIVVIVLSKGADAIKNSPHETAWWLPADT